MFKTTQQKKKASTATEQQSKPATNDPKVTPAQEPKKSCGDPIPVKKEGRKTRRSRGGLSKKKLSEKN